MMKRMKWPSSSYVVFMVAFSVGGMVSGANWTGGAGPDEPYWDMWKNWSNSAAPTASDGVTVNNVIAADGVTLLYPVVDTLEGGKDECMNLWLGNSGTGYLDMESGNLTVGAWLQIGVNGGTGVLNLSGGALTCSTQHLLVGHTDGGHGTINMTGGSITVAGADKHFLLGNDASGTGLMNMDGGTVNATGQFNVGQSGQGHLRMAGGQINASGPYVHVPNAGNSTGKVELFGGTLQTPGRLVMRGNERSSMDLSGGTLILGLDTALQGYIESGQITAYGGLGTVNVEVVDGNTVVTGSADPNIMAKAWQPSPTDTEIVFDDKATLTWVAGKGADTHKVYFGTDPNTLTLLTADPNQGVLSVDFHTKVAGLDLGSTYFWRVDEVKEADAGVATGDLWSFRTLPLEMARPVYPAMGATGVEITDLLLQWEPGLGAVSHDVYFGTDAADLALVSEDQTDPNYLVTEILIKGQTYYWRIDEYDGTDTHTGLVLSFKTTAPAGTSTWTDAGDGNLWSTPDNWSAGLPGIGTNARIVNDLGPAVIDDNTNAYCSKLELGWDNTNVDCRLEVEGGSLTIEGELLLVRMLSGMATLVIRGGVVNTGWIRGWHGDMWIDMTGGELNVAGNLEIPRSYAADVGTKGVFKLHGGVARVDQLTLNANANIVCNLDITDGVLILNGDKRARINDYIVGGLITAFDGTGSIAMDYDLSNPGKTTVKACAEILSADFNGDCAVDELDRELLMSDWGYQTPSEAVWDFDMNTDPVGPGQFDLKVRESKGDYSMEGFPGSLTVTGGQFTLDIQADVSGVFDMGLHWVVKSASTLPLRVWFPIASNSTPGTYALPHVAVYLDADGSQAVSISNGKYWWVGDYDPFIFTGFDADKFVDITMECDRQTDTCTYTITDGTKTETGTLDYVTSGGAGEGGDWVVLSDDGAMGYIDHLGVIIHGTKWHSPYDINKDGVVDQLDLDILESEMTN